MALREYSIKDKIKTCVALDICAVVSVETLVLVTLPFIFNAVVISFPLA